MSKNGQIQNGVPSENCILELKKLINSNQSTIAEIKARELIKKYPKSHTLLNLLGVSLITQNKLEEAEQIFQKIIKDKSDFSDAYNNLANIYIAQKKTDKAVYLLEKALVNKPDSKQAKFNLAKIYTDLGNSLLLNRKIKESIMNYEKAIKYTHTFVDAHNNLGIALQKLNKTKEASLCFGKAIEIKSDYFEAYNNLGNALIELNRIEEAVENFENAIKINPGYVEAHNNLGIALNNLRKFEDSVVHFKKAIELNPKFTKAYNNLAGTLVQQGRFEEAIENYKMALKLDPKKTEHAINSNLLIPTIPESRKDQEFWRGKYSSSIDSLEKNKYSIDDPQKIINPPIFNLAYSDHNNLKIVKKVSNFFRNSIPEINYLSQKKSIIEKKVDKFKKIRLGFISEFFTDHTIGKLYKGLIKTIDKNKFELIVFHNQKTKPGLVKKEIDSYSNKVIDLKGKISQQQKQIENELLDIIFYPDIGMTSSTYFLAHARLAPVQIVSWGHPETSGIDTIDYFLSTSLMENEKSNLFYSERLICIKDFAPMYFIPPTEPNIELNRSDFKLPENKNIYCCPQTLFKIHPDFDEFLSEIAKKDSNSNIIMLETQYKLHVEKLKKRWLKNFPILNDKVIFLKSMPLKKFLSLIKICDVLLDPIYFGGGISFSESMVVGTPTVTMPTTFMRSRVTSGLYKQMKILNPPIAKDMKEYVNLAIEIAKNKKKNNELRKTFKSAANLHLFNNIKAVKLIEKFFEESHKSAQNSSHLKDGYVI